jgi:hypothetical protein
VGTDDRPPLLARLIHLDEGGGRGGQAGEQCRRQAQRVSAPFALSSFQVRWRAPQGSNLRPTASKAGALSTELWAPISGML